MHITTRITGKKYDGLLAEKGFRGFPSLAFMDADGIIIGKPRERTVASFDEMHTNLARYQALLERQKAGEKGLEFDLFVAEYHLGNFTSRATLAKLKEFKNLTTEQQRVAAQIELDETVSGLVERAMEDEKAIGEVSTQLLRLLDEGKAPSKRVMLDVWAILAHTAQKDGKPDLLERCIQALRADFSERKDVQNWANSLDDKLKKMRAK